MGKRNLTFKKGIFFQSKPFRELQSLIKNITALKNHPSSDSSFTNENEWVINNFYENEIFEINPMVAQYLADMSEYIFSKDGNHGDHLYLRHELNCPENLYNFVPIEDYEYFNKRLKPMMLSPNSNPIQTVKVLEEVMKKAHFSPYQNEVISSYITFSKFFIKENGIREIEYIPEEETETCYSVDVESKECSPSTEKRKPTITISSEEDDDESGEFDLGNKKSSLSIIPSGLATKK